MPCSGRKGTFGYSMKKIFVFGSLNMDLVISCDRMPQGGETLSGYGFFTNPGGKGANQTAACGKLGGRVAMCGHVGADAFGRELTENLTACGADVSAVLPLEGVSTGIAVIIVEHGENRIILDAGANAKMKKEDVDTFLANAEKSDLFLAQAEINFDMLEYGLRSAKEKGMTVLFNPAPALPALKEFLKYADYILPNETELALLTGETDIESGAEKLSRTGACVVVTLGSKGCYYRTGEQSAYLACPKVKAVDTTAAGDTFCGGFAVRLSAGDALEDALNFALRAASLAVTRKGAQQSIPFASELEQ